MCTVIFVGLEAFLSSSSHLSIGCVILWKPLRRLRLDWKVGDQVCKSQHKSKALGVSDRGFEDESDEKAQETEGTFQQLTKQKSLQKRKRSRPLYTGHMSQNQPTATHAWHRVGSVRVCV